MVQLSAKQTPGPLLSWLGLLTGLAVTGIGVGLVSRSHEDLFGAVWSALMLVLGVIVLISFVGIQLAKRSQVSSEPARDVTFESERARFFARRSRPGTLAGNAVLVLLGGWFLVMGVVGAEENWVWPVLAAFPAAYFLGFPVLRAVGLFRPGGVWLTPTRLVNEQFGLRSEIALSDVDTAMPRVDDVRVVPGDPSAIHHKRRTPRLWCARLVLGEMLILDGIEGGIDGLAAEIRARAEVSRNDGQRRRRGLWGQR
ncbi:hypothetical protein ABTZ46_08120 [Nocardioides sp. NPDC126508]